MKLKYGQLIIYEVNKNYLQYLSNYDNNVRLKSDRRYTGILVTDNNVDYCIPLTCQIKKRNPKLTINIKDKEKTIAQLTINNMIPVNENLLKIVDVSSDKYKDYLNKEIQFLRSKDNMQVLLSKVENVFSTINNSKHPDNTFFKDLCANYSLLEEKCKEYIEK